MVSSTEQAETAVAIVRNSYVLLDIGGVGCLLMTILRSRTSLCGSVGRVSTDQKTGGRHDSKQVGSRTR